MAIHNINNYELKAGKSILVDTNIWLLLYANLHESDRKKDIESYANFFEKAITRNSTFYITSGILSEFSNVLLRADFNYLKQNEANKMNSFKKDYVGSEAYAKKVLEIGAYIKSILKIDQVEKINCSFRDINLEQLKHRFNLIDWNDAYLIELSKLTNALILTDDNDFKLVDDNTINILSNRF